ncbi:protein SHORT-ROOT-like [Aristolochia californica]|uniref:protein SHORT-ROOT-like n=1 Tax=Aristolochia californica TaxID=171875 RepID=UPI0035D69B63
MQSSSQSQTNHTSTSLNPSSDSGDSAATEKWAARLLQECAKAISDKDSTRIHHLLWMLNELASPYGDTQQKLASHFLQALFCKATESGDLCHKTLSSVAEKSDSFESARKVILKFQEVSPWTTFGHVASNGAILEAMAGETKLHIIDISNTYCTQWPTLLEALVTKNDDAPSLRLTVVVTLAAARSVMREIGRRMEKFARLMGIPFEFHVVSKLNRLAELTKEELGLREEEAVAVNCIGALRRVDTKARGAVISMLRSLQPKVVTVVEEEADFTGTRDDFVKCFDECLRFYDLFFEMLEESFVPASHERLMLERECSRSIVRVLACDQNEGGVDCERRERGRQWCLKLKEAFSPFGLNEDSVDDVKSLLKRYKAGWSFVQAEGDESGLHLMWKEEAVVWASAWKPIS